MGAKYDNRITEVILESINIVDLISEYTPLKRTGRNYKGLCPFHNEKTPSFSVSEDKQFYHCFGCGVGGDAIKFVQEIENFDFLDAIEYLADKYGVDIDAYKKHQLGEGRACRSARGKKKLCMPYPEKQQSCTIRNCLNRVKPWNILKGVDWTSRL